MKKALAVVFVLAVAGAAFAQTDVNHGNKLAHVSNFAGGGSGGNLIYHTGGSVIPVAHVVMIFWGPSFANTASPDYVYAQTLQNFRNQFGTTPEFNTITQYYQTIGGVTTFVQLSNLALGSADWFDTSN